MGNICPAILNPVDRNEERGQANSLTNLIREGKTYQIATLMQTGKALGMQMINSHLMELVQKGVVAAEEAIDKAIDKENLKTYLRGKGLLEG